MNYRNRFTKFLFVLSISAVMLASATVMVAPAYADNVVPLFNPLKETVDASAPIQSLAAIFINLLFGIAGSVALAMYVWGGALWLTSAGSEKQVTKGKGVFQWTTLGIIMMFAAYTLVSYIFGSFGTGAVGGGGPGGGGTPNPSGGTPNGGGAAKFIFCPPKGPGLPCEPVPNTSDCGLNITIYQSLNECVAANTKATKDYTCFKYTEATAKFIPADSFDAAQTQCTAANYTAVIQMTETEFNSPQTKWCIFITSEKKSNGNYKLGCTPVNTSTASKCSDKSGVARSICFKNI